MHPGGASSLLFENRKRADGVHEHTNYISANGRVIGYYKSFSDDTAPYYRFFYADQQGSPLVMQDDQGTNLERLAYEPYGKRRNPNGSDDPNNAIDPVTTDRGYTGHQHLDEVGLIHMNGRIYDPVLARFISPDPLVQDPSHLLSYNRYGYAFNNPLGYSDPSGYWSIGGLHVSGATTQMIASIALTAYLGYGDLTWLTNMAEGTVGLTGNAVANAVAGGFAGGVVGTGTLEGGVHGAVSATLFTLAGNFGPADVISPERIGAHAMAGCISAEMSGDQCGSGALAAGVAKAATFAIDGLDPIGKGIAVSVIGGTASTIGGGKFANGAQTAAYGYLFNELSFDPEMRRAIASVRSRSSDAETYFAGLDRSPRPYHFMIDESLGPATPGVTIPLEGGGALVLVNPAALRNVELPSLGGGYFRGITIDRVIAHELGHAVLTDRNIFDENSHARFSVSVERAVMRQLAPNAPVRLNEGGRYIGPRLCGGYQC